MKSSFYVCRESIENVSPCKSEDSDANINAQHLLLFLTLLFTRALLIIINTLACQHCILKIS